MNSGETWRLDRRPALDGLRGVAIALVLLCHTGAPGLAAAGPVGVTLFFVLSGFLITSLLLEERARTGGVSLRAFYARRARRLLPALFASSAVVAVVGVFVSDFFAWRNLAAVLLYAGNWVETLGGQLDGLEGTWSLAVEEQFYVVWPIVFLLAMRLGRRWALGVTVAGVVGVMLERSYLMSHGAGGPRLYFATDMHADALLLGCLLAFLLHGGAVRASRPVLATIALTACAACSLVPGNAAWTEAAPFATIPAALAIWLSVRGHYGPGWLSTCALVWLGRRSYGIYLWNCPVAWLLASTDWPWVLKGCALLAFSLPVAATSWRWLEEPWLRKRVDGQSNGNVVATEHASEHLAGSRVGGRG